MLILLYQHKDENTNSNLWIVFHLYANNISENSSNILQTRRNLDMKATGIVRRIDDLGRVVIPKEIRRTMRIREGEPLEIFTDKEGEVILKKYSPIGELGDFAMQYAESLAKTSGHIVCIADRDTIIAVSGGMKKDFSDKTLSAQMENIIEERSFFIAKNSADAHIPITANESGEHKIVSQVIVSIVAEGDPVGAVILLSTDSNKIMGEVELKLAQSAAGFLGKQMEQ